MRWLADECVSPYLVQVLRQMQHDVIFALENMRGSGDSDVLTTAIMDNRLLLTEDLDFGELAFREQRSAIPGIVLIRMCSRDRNLKRERLAAAISHYGDGLFGQYLVVEENRFRGRALTYP